MPNPTVPDFTDLAARKLADLLEKGFVITGYCFERQTGGTQPQRGFVDFAGFVGWWRPTTQITGSPNVDLMALINELAEADAAHGVADMKGGQDVE